jgi:cyclopropane-fatty-acyl-phospholipid synthase
MRTSSPTTDTLTAIDTAHESHGERESGSARLGAIAGRPARRMLIRMLRGVACGSISIELPDGQRVEARGALPGPQAGVVLHRWRALGRLATRGDIGLAESYRDGDWSSPDLTALLEFGTRNEAACGHVGDAPWPARMLFRMLHRMRDNTRNGSRENIAFHYDLGNEFYGHWLDPEMTYSSALYKSEVQSLEQAQAAKLDRVIELLELDQVIGVPKVLEIGCGWGALALQIAKRHQAHVTGLTLSAQQLAHARNRVTAEGADAQIDLRLQDYRDVDGQYDRIVSIEMLEAVGERYWPRYFETLRQRLKPGGIAVIQVITIAEEHFDHYRRNADFIQRFIFPGGMLPSVTAMREQAKRAGLSLRTEESFGASYAKTLVEWRRRFLRAWPAIETLGFDTKFRRLWEYYLCYCEAGFHTGRVDVGIYALRHSPDAWTTQLA